MKRKRMLYMKRQLNCMKMKIDSQRMCLDFEHSDEGLRAIKVCLSYQIALIALPCQ